jgi:4-amino-4-deoxy-L-arabinose transferase-like glycosyltransferase
MSSVLLLASLTIACLLPFASKPFNVDDPLYVWSARQIQAHPTDPYGFRLNWYRTEMPFAQVTKNPPLTCYYLAAAAAVVGWSERALHAAFLLPAILAVLGTNALARRLCTRPRMAAAATLLTPVFLVCSTSVCCDTMLVAWWVWAVVFWMGGIEQRRWWMLGLSAVLVAAAGLTKYFGVALVPLLLAYAGAKQRRLGWWALWMLIPITVFLAYNWATRQLYGRGLLLDAALYPGTIEGRPGWISQCVIAMAFSGGCAAIVLFFAPLVWSRKELVVGFVWGALAAALLLVARDVRFRPTDGMRWAVAIQFGIFAAGGFGLLALAVKDLYRRRDAESLLLAMWILGAYVFAAFVNWSINGRTVLPMVPAVAIVLMRCLEWRAPSPADKRLDPSIWPLIPAAVLALLVTRADYNWATMTRAAAGTILTKYHDDAGTLHFQGHWGFQYYMEQGSAKPFDFESSPPQGDLVVVPGINSNCAPLAEPTAERLVVIGAPYCRWGTTMDADAGAGFYTYESGPVPFLLGPVPPDQYVVYRLR